MWCNGKSLSFTGPLLSALLVLTAVPPGFATPVDVAPPPANASAAMPDSMETPLEKTGYSRISRSDEISAYLKTLDTTHADARIDLLGHSVQGRPIEALVISRDSNTAQKRLRLMITGSQHGAAEPAGGEAMLVLARELLAGKLRHVTERMDIILIPDANPDGRDLIRRSNANRININTDFVLMSQPETRVLATAVRRYQPDILLDSHESAVLKRKTLGLEGYLTDFYAQFEIANNPAIPEATRAFALNTLLPDMLKRASDAGLPAHRYIGEITSTRQPITHGGLTLRNFRNTAGINGALSFLVETRLDSPENSYPTYRNIGARVGRQLICLNAFIDVAYTRHEEIAAQTAQLRQALPTEPVSLTARYIQDPAHPEVAIALRRRDTGALQTLMFRDHRKIDYGTPAPMPTALAITAHQDRLAPFLETHGIAYERKPNGEIVVNLAQPSGRQALMLLDTRSDSSVFHHAEYSALAEHEHDGFLKIQQQDSDSE